MPKKKENTLENKSTRGINISKEDKIYTQIQLKLNNNETLSNEEKIYLTLYENIKNELKMNNFSLIKYKNNHTIVANAEKKNIFHKSLKKLTKKQRKIF